MQFCEPDADASPQRAHLDRQGEGVSYIGFEVPDTDHAKEQARTQGMPVLMLGRRANRTGYTYDDTAGLAGVDLLTRVTNLPGK